MPQKNSTKNTPHHYAKDWSLYSLCYIIISLPDHTHTVLDTFLFCLCRCCSCLPRRCTSFYSMPNLSRDVAHKIDGINTRRYKETFTRTDFDCYCTDFLITLQNYVPFVNNENNNISTAHIEDSCKNT